jgi:hypothetical protein
MNPLIFRAENLIPPPMHYEGGVGGGIGPHQEVLHCCAKDFGSAYGPGIVRLTRRAQASLTYKNERNKFYTLTLINKKSLAGSFTGGFALLRNP